MSALSRLGNRLYEGETSIEFVAKRRRRLWYAISAAILLIALGGLFLRGLNLGIEFEGGSEYRVTLPADQVTQPMADEVRDDVAGLGIDDASAPVVTTSGSEAILVQTEQMGTGASDRVTEQLRKTTGASAEDISQSEIGASWGEEVAKRSLIGLCVFLVLVVLLIWAYFRQWKMSVAAIVALAHDVLITIGVYALSGFEVTPATVTGLLTILGFSLYDTVVVFDKVRENTRGHRTVDAAWIRQANLAVNQTLVRSINTSLVALIPVAALLYVGIFMLGSGSLKDLALALFVGMAAGAYSSIFIATPLFVALKEREVGKRVDPELAAKRAAAADPYAAVMSGRGRAPSQGVPDELSGTEAADEVRASQHANRPRPAKPADRDRPEVRLKTAQRPVDSKPEASGKGRIAPEAHGPVGRSGAAKRIQPTRAPRSKRGKR